MTQTRNESRYINMRKFHGQVKKKLVSGCVPRTKKTIKLLDVSIGRFGDIHNYHSSGIKYVVGIDPDEDSIKEAISRYNNMKNKYKMYANLSVQRISDESISTPDSQYDIITCNFTLHYLFETEAHLINSLYNISSRLKPNGYFVGTTLDGDVLDNLTGVEYVLFQKGGNYESESPFGRDYVFNLQDIDYSGNYFTKHINNDVEYRVSIPIFVEYAKRFGLKLVKCESLDSLEWDRTKFSNSEKIVSSSYKTFVFIKTPYQ